MSHIPDVTIVGAGLTGALLAKMLARRGLSVDVYEKRCDIRNTTGSAGRSINLALAERGIHGLQMADAFDTVEAELVPMRGRLLHAVDGSTEFQPYGSRESEMIYSVSRGGLNGRLISAAEDHADVIFHFESPCKGVNFARNEVVFSPGGQDQSVPYNVLLGADGAGSVIRSAIMEATGGKCETDFLDHGYKELCLPPSGDGQHKIQREALHIWPRGGFMLIALPNTDGSFTMTLFLANEGEVSFAALSEDAAVGRFFDQQFPDASQLMPDLATEFEENPTGLLGTVTCWPWTCGADPAWPNVAILGDASHAIVPFHGQGMNAGFEDCCALIQAVDNIAGTAKPTSADWSRILINVSHARKPNADAIAKMALENYIVMRDSVRDPKFHLRKQLEFELERRFPERFIPRYSMVMFHRIPYDEVYRRGAAQAALLDNLLQGAEEIGEIDFDAAQRVVMAS